MHHHPHDSAPESAACPFDLPQPGDLIDEHEVAAILAVRVNTVRNWRATGRGPTYLKIGCRAVRYRRTDVAKFIDAGVAP